MVTKNNCKSLIKYYNSDFYLISKLLYYVIHWNQ